MLKTDTLIHIQVALTSAELVALSELGGDLGEHVRLAVEQYSEGADDLVDETTRLLAVPIRREAYEKMLRFWTKTPYNAAVQAYLEGAA